MIKNLFVVWKRLQMDFSRKRVFRVKGQSIRSKRGSANCELLFGAKCSPSVCQHAASLRTLCNATPLCSINIYYHHQLKFQSTLFNLSNKEVQRKYKKSLLVQRKRNRTACLHNSSHQSNQRGNPISFEFFPITNCQVW